MNVRIADGATSEEASAIATALAEHIGADIEVYVGHETEPTAVREVDSTPKSESTRHENADSKRSPHAGDSSSTPAVNDGGSDDLEPTERERKLWTEIEDILEGGPEKYRDQLADEGKLFVRDRLELWFSGDGNEFLFEDGTFAAFDEWHPDGAAVDDADAGDMDADGSTESNDRLPADGLITGAATFENRDIHFMANDYTVKRGSMAAKGVEKFLRMQQRALKTGQPVLYLMDSSGGRIDQQTGFFANREGIGKYYYNHSMLSGRVPQICVLYGPCIAGAAYTPVFADFTVMVEGMSAMAIASPRKIGRAHV